MDFEVDEVPRGGLRLDVDVAFNPLSVRRGAVTRVDFYIGSTGAEISVQATEGAIQEHTGPSTLSVSYANKQTLVRQTTLSLTPSLKTKKGTAESELSLGAITREASHAREFAASFASEERFLATTVLRDTIKWTVTLPRGEKAIRDFLVGNLYLFAICHWPERPRRGTITVRPSDVRFFDDQRRPLSALKSLVMEFVLWRDQRELMNRDGFETTFQEVLT